MWIPLTTKDIEDYIYGGKTVSVPSSSNVSWWQYNYAAETLTVGYLNLSMYTYGRVSFEEAAELLKVSLGGGSVGSWVWDNIRVRGKGNGHLTQKPFGKH